MGSPSVMVHVQIERLVDGTQLSHVAEVQLYLAPSAGPVPSGLATSPSARFKELEAITHQTYEISRDVGDASTLTSPALFPARSWSVRGEFAVAPLEVWKYSKLEAPPF